MIIVDDLVQTGGTLIECAKVCNNFYTLLNLCHSVWLVLSNVCKCIYSIIHMHTVKAAYVNLLYYCTLPCLWCYSMYFSMQLLLLPISLASQFWQSTENVMVIVCEILNTGFALSMYRLIIVEWINLSADECTVLWRCYINPCWMVLFFALGVAGGRCEMCQRIRDTRCISKELVDKVHNIRTSRV